MKHNWYCDLTYLLREAVTLDLPFNFRSFSNYEWIYLNNRFHSLGP